MSRRLPPSAASRLVDALVARSPAVRWDDLPPLAASDEGAVLDSSGAAMPGDRLVLRWVAPTLVLGGGGEETVHEARMGEDT